MEKMERVVSRKEWAFLFAQLVVLQLHTFVVFMDNMLGLKLIDKSGMKQNIRQWTLKVN